MEISKFFAMLFAPSTACKAFLFTPLFIIRKNAREVKAFSHFFEKLYPTKTPLRRRCNAKQNLSAHKAQKSSLPQICQTALLVLSEYHLLDCAPL